MRPERSIGIDGAVIANRPADDIKLNEPHGVYGVDSLGLAAVGLFHDVLEVNHGTGSGFAEVDDDVGAFAWDQSDAGDGDSFGQHPAVITDLQHRSIVAQAQFIDAGQ